MRLLQLTALLSLPASLLAFVILPEADVFASPSLPESASHKPASSKPKSHISCPKAKQSSIHAANPTTGDEEEGQVRLKPLLPPHGILETVAVEDDWIKILKISPKFVIPTKTANEDSDDDGPLPVVIWHGLGDSADAQGLNEVAEMMDQVHPGTYTYIISLGNGAGSSDRQATFFGNVTVQIESVCHMLAKDPILRTAPAIDAIGFSQGGQFLRGYIERCGDWAPKVRSLITFGSQHNGIAEFQKCASSTDWICQGANALLKSSTVWSDFVQSRLVPAQYYRDTNDFENYLEHSNFLADINNERKVKNATYADNLASLEKFVMIVFKDDKTVIPKESGWFAQVNTTSSAVTKLRERPIYKEDWIGLKRLDEKGGLDFLSLPGEHMNLAEKDLTKLFAAYLGPAGKQFDGRSTEAIQRWKVEL